MPTTQIHDSTVNLVGGNQVNQNNTYHIHPQGEHLPYALLSPFNCKDRTRCLEGTRADILDEIFRWIGIGDSQPCPELDRDKDADTVAADTRVFWINGSAGTGKTTIAYTVADVCKAYGVLGASFFCSRDDADCSNPNLIFTTIAYQLGMFNALFQAEVTRAMKSNRDIGYTTPPYQLEELIIKPLRTLRNSIPPCVIVLDALDECKEAGMTSVILSSLSRHVNELFPLKFLVTSRPESHITAVFKSSKLNPVTHRYVLHEVELGVVQSDIEHYLSTKLAFTRELYCINDKWPSEADIHSLTILSSALFIFASTSVRFIEDRNYSNPKDQLARLLCNSATATEPSSPDYGLDQLYTQVLNHAFPTISSHFSGRLKKILGTIILLRDPLSSPAVERLLGVQPGTVQETLRHLHSVIMVPDNDSQVIRTLHPSFFDFITNPARCLNPQCVVDPGSQHTLLACACLDVMKRLKRDICGIRNPSLLNSEVGDLPTHVMTFIRPELQYACRHWAWHLENASIDILIDPLNKFLSKYLLYWVEALSLMGDLRNGLLALRAAQQVIAKSARDVTDTMALLRDCERFTLEFFPVISACSLQVYHSALLFTPEEALIKQTYKRELDIPIKVISGLDEGWNSCIRTIEGHSNGVKSVAFSPDGSRIVSGSTDNTVRLWDAVSGAHLNTFMGHSEWVYSVAFSPDATRIVSGSLDKTIRLWDVASGAHLNTFMGHSFVVTLVTFSLDGTRIVSGSGFTVSLLDAVSGAHLNTFKSSHWVNSVALSPDGMRIISGSYDTTVQLWNAVSGAHLATLEGHSMSVNSVVFSFDGSRILSGSADKTIRLWDAVSGAHLNTFEGHSMSVSSVTFSPDGTRIVSGSYDTTVRLWDTVSGAFMNAFMGHPNFINSVAFSPDGTRIVSGSDDKTVRLWDAVGGANAKTSMANSNLIKLITFSPDGTRIASGFDKTVQLWDAVSGAHLSTFKGHSGGVNSVTFSHDGTRIVAGSEGGTLRLWDIVSGTHLNTFKGHSNVTSAAFSRDYTRIVSAHSQKIVHLWDAVTGENLSTFDEDSMWPSSVSFSSDSTRIVAASFHKTLRLWDAVSGAHLNTFEGHSGLVNSVAFSADGTRIVSGSDDKTVRLWDTISGAPLNTFEGHSGWVNSVAFSADGTRIISGSHDTTVRLWDAVSGVSLNTFNDSNRVMSVALSPDGTHIISGSFDKTVRLWDVVSGACLNIFRGHSLSVNSVAFSSDGSRILSGSNDKTVRLWDVVSGAHLNTFIGHSNQVNSVSFSPDGTRIISGSHDKTVRLWDAVSGAHLITWAEYPKWVESVAFSFDRPRIASGSGSKTVQLWDVFSGTHPNTPHSHSVDAESIARSGDLLSTDGTSPIFGSISRDGWVHSHTLNRRIFWVPFSHRPITWDAKGVRAAFGTEDNRLIILDFSGMEVYFRNLML